MEHHCKTCQCQTKTEYICRICNYKTDDITSVYIKKFNKNRKQYSQIYCLECLHKKHIQDDKRVKYMREFNNEKSKFTIISGRRHPEFEFNFGNFEIDKLIESYEQCKNEHIKK
jgi:hypothetical protein